MPNQREHTMNWPELEADWKQLKGKVKEKWGRLTDDELSQTEGRREQLLGLIEERYAIARDEVERQLDALFGGGRE
jgi:uncharacterized protein YjbJ (UPF0337 family)